MLDIDKSKSELIEELEELRARLEDSSEVLNAIRGGKIDAIVVNDADGYKTFTLREADYPYRVFVESMSEVAATLTFEGKIIYSNFRLAIMLGVPLGKLVGTYLSSYVIHTDKTIFSAALNSETRTSGVVEIVLERGNNDTIPVLISYYPLRSEELNAINVIITDLSERKRSEQIIASERLANSILEQAGETIIVCDETGKIVRANKLAHELCHRNPLFHPMDEVFLLKDTKTGHMFSVLNTLRGNVSKSVEVTIDIKDQDTFYLLLNATPLKNSDGKVLGCVIVLANITEGKLAEKALLASEAKHRKLFEANIMGVNYANHDRITEANDAFLEIIGYSRVDLAAVIDLFLTTPVEDNYTA